ncbi:hypothetical protein [Tahibacter caeni]|uniref:hypothetical protein n=1 Tax=Tahibacter caeni TaxID=1453545 RepID=UPI0021494CE4|nr:hypothetical protein [Tahibacter caeni]
MHSSNILGRLAPVSPLQAKKNPDVLANDPGESGRTGGGIALFSAVGYVELLPRLLRYGVDRTD